MMSMAPGSQTLTDDAFGLAKCTNLEAITFSFFVHDDQWYIPNYKRWECIRYFLSSLATRSHNWPNLRTIIFSINRRDNMLHYRPSDKDQPFLRDVEDAILQLNRRRSCPRGPQADGSEDQARDVGILPSVRLRIVPQCELGKRSLQFGETESQVFRKAFPTLYEKNILHM